LEFWYANKFQTHSCTQALAAYTPIPYQSQAKKNMVLLYKKREKGGEGG